MLSDTKHSQTAEERHAARADECLWDIATILGYQFATDERQRIYGELVSHFRFVAEDATEVCKPEEPDADTAADAR